MGLFVVGTPIGNLADITLRALEVLRSVDAIAAEDTRRVRRLLEHYDIPVPRLFSHHEYNERESAQGLIDMLKKGMNIALVSNAGMPLISDPGYVLVNAAIEEGIPVSVIPGPSAVLSALVISGLPVHRFHFLGFPPRGEKALRELLASVSELEGTLIFFESPRRLIRLLGIAEEELGKRRAAVAREMTKMHEEMERGTLGDLLERFSERSPRGEVTILIEGRSRRGRRIKEEGDG